MDEYRNCLLALLHGDVMAATGLADVMEEIGHADASAVRIVSGIAVGSESWEEVLAALHVLHEIAERLYGEFKNAI